MPLSRAILCGAASLLIALGLAASMNSGSSTAHEIHGPEAEGAMGVTWALEPTSVNQMATETQALVQASVASVTQGPPLSFEIDGEPQSIPTERVQLAVTGVLEGSAPSSITLFKIGDSSTYLDGDPPYVAGDEYVMFVRRRLNDAGTAFNADGTWLPVSPEGRLLEHEQGHVSTFVETPVAESLDGQTPEQIDDRVDEVGSE